jgi:hypothetical protein
MLGVPVTDIVPLLLVVDEPVVVLLEVIVLEVVIDVEVLTLEVPDLLDVDVPVVVLVAQFVQDANDDDVPLLDCKGVTVCLEVPLPLLETVLVPVVEREAVAVLLEEPLLVEPPDDVSLFEADDDSVEVFV